MQTIATNKRKGYPLFGKHRYFWHYNFLFAVIGLVVIISLSVEVPFFENLIIPVFCYLFVSLILSVIFWFRNLTTPFAAYTDGTQLFVDFVNMNHVIKEGWNSSYIKRETYPQESLNRCTFPLKRIMGYKLHTFFKQPFILEIQTFEGESKVLNTVIPIDVLPPKEVQKLIDFLEQILPQHRNKISGFLN